MAPPISEHEVIEVTLSHDMEGYDGVESVVYRALARVSTCQVLCSIEVSDGARVDLATSRGWRSRREYGQGRESPEH